MMCSFKKTFNKRISNNTKRVTNIYNSINSKKLQQLYLFYYVYLTVYFSHKFPKNSF